MQMDLSNHTPELVYMFTGFGAFMILSLVVEVIIRRRRKTDPESLSSEALRREMSEFDLFMESASQWNIKRERVDRDFKLYLRDGSLPFYIRQMLRTLES